MNKPRKTNYTILEHPNCLKRVKVTSEIWFWSESEEKSGNLRNDDARRRGREVMRERQ